MVDIIQQLVPRDKVLVIAGTNDQTSITVHETGNLSRGAGAQAHANLQSQGGFPASWHFQVDDKQIIQSYLLTTRCQHAGDGARGKGNTGSIAIEVCINEDSDRREAWRKTTALVRYLMKELNISAANVVQHNNWSGKDCPMYLRRGQPITWATFKKTLTGSAPTSTPAVKPTATPAKAPKPAPARKTDNQLADEVIAGKHGSGDARRRSLGNRYQAVQRIVNQKLAARRAPVPKAKSIQVLAREVLDGKHGNGDARRRSLGSNFAAVQAEVNRMSRPSQQPRKTDAQLAQEVIDGRHGSGQARINALGARYSAVQRIVNQRLR